MKKFLIWLVALGSLVWLSAAVMTAGVLARAWAFVILWDWFVVPNFGADSLSLPTAAGLVTMSYLLLTSKQTNAAAREDDEDDEDETKKETSGQLLRRLGRSVLMEAMVPAIAVALGWIFLQAMGS